MTIRTFVRPTSTGIVIEVTPEELNYHEGLDYLPVTFDDETKQWSTDMGAMAEWKLSDPFPGLNRLLVAAVVMDAADALYAAMENGL